MNDLPAGYLSIYGADEIILASPRGKAWTFPPDTEDAVLWERAWEDHSKEWMCQWDDCWVCEERAS